jgi:hypothetical protein
MVVLKRRVGVLVPLLALPRRWTASHGGKGTARSCLLVVSVLLGVSACGVPPGQARRLIAVDVRPSEATAAAPGTTVQFSATGTFDQLPTTQTGLAAQWVSSDSNVVTVEFDTGLAMCVAKGGPVTVTESVTVDAGAVYGFGTLSCIGPRALIGLQVEPGIAQAVAPGGAVLFTATGSFDEAPFTQASLPAEWTSSDPSVATVEAGVATCIVVGGPISVTASAPGRGGALAASGELTCVVYKRPPPPIRGGRCQLLSGDVMSGYCYGVHNGVCERAYDPTDCPIGQAATLPELEVCASSGAINVDASGSCTP